LLVNATPKPKWIDLTYPFNNETVIWPGDLKFKHTKVYDNFTADGYYFSLYEISGSEHAGTHLDAPRHFYEGKWTTDQIPLEKLIGPAVKIDVSSKAAQNPDYQMMPSDLEAWEEKHGKIPDDVILLIFFDWGKHYANKKKYLGTDTNNASLLHFPGIHPNASRWLVNNRKIKLVGVDTPSLDYGQTKLSATHIILFEKNIPGLENVAHMDKLPTKGFTVYAAPMFITDGSGGPCRIFARLDEDDKKGCIVNAGIKSTSMNMFLGITVSLFFAIL